MGNMFKVNYKDTRWMANILVPNEIWMAGLYSKAQPAFPCAKLKIETPEQDVKYVQS